MINKKNNEIHIRLLAEEKQELIKKARESGISMSAYIRGLVKNQKTLTKDEFLELKRLNNEVNHIGNNINQIATHTNSGFYSENEKRKLFALMNRLIHITEEIIKDKSINNKK